MELRTSALLFAGALAVLLLSGCLGGMRGQAQPQGGGQPAPQQPVTPPSQQPQQPGGSIGDADISGPGSEDEAELPGEELLPPPVDDAAMNLTLDDSDIDLGVIEEDFVISEEDIVEPA